MADPKELFPILRDTGNAGASPDKAIDATTAAAALLGLVAFAFKDASGNVVLPQLTATGRVPVDTEAFTGTHFKANGELAAGSLSLALVTSVEITISLLKVYSRFGLICSCRQSSLFQVIYVNDASGTPTETVIGEAVVGPGQYTWSGDFPEWSLDTTAGTGVQKIRVKAKNFETLSSLRATLSFFEQNTL